MHGIARFCDPGLTTAHVPGQKRADLGELAEVADGQMLLDARDPGDCRADTTRPAGQFRG